MAVFQKYENGNWYITIRYRDPTTGKTKRFRRSTGPGTTKRQAQKLEQEWRRELEVLGAQIRGAPVQGQNESSKSAAFSGLAKRFIDDYAMVQNKPSEVAGKMQIIKNHLFPFFGHKPIHEIRRRDIDTFVALKKREDLHPKTINNILGTLRRLFNFAVEWELISHSPMKGAKNLKVPDDTFDFYSTEETDLFLAECQKSELNWYPFFVTAFNTGMRLGELSALRWQDIDFEHNVIHVRKSVWRGHEGTPKGGKNRQIPMNQQLRQVLWNHSEGKDESDYAFRSNSGIPVNENTHRKPFARIINRTELKRIRFHDVRHSFASQLVMNGVPLRMVQQLLGHSTIAMTERYSHLTPDATHDAVRTLTGGLVNSDATKSGPYLAPIGKNEKVLQSPDKEKARKYKDLRAC